MTYLRFFVCILFVLYVIIKLLKKFYFSGGRCPKKFIHDLKDMTVLITGASSGIGLAAAKKYVKYKAKKVIICSRSRKRGKEAAKLLRKLDTKTDMTEIKFIQMDLSSLKSVETCAKRIEREEIDIMILNAACFTPGERRLSSETGVELMFSVGFLGHFHLVNCLFDQLVARNVRVIATTGGQHMMPLRFPTMKEVFSKMEKTGTIEVFGLSKTCLMLLMKNLYLRFQEEDSFASSYYLHPGITSSGMGLGDQKVPLLFRLMRTFVMEPMTKIVGKTEEEICQTHLYLTFAPRSELKGGGYYIDCKNVKELEFFTNKENIRRVSELGYQIIEKIRKGEEEEEEVDEVVEEEGKKEEEVVEEDVVN